MSRKKLYSERFEICLTPKQRKELERKASLDGVTISELLRSIIKEYLCD